MARTAVVAGTATAVSNRVSRRQGRRWAAREQQNVEHDAYQQQVAQPAPAPAQQMPAAAPAAAPPAPALSQAEILDHLKQLGELKNAGVLTEEEFATQKARILAGIR